jgi:hypothetical protein
MLKSVVKATGPSILRIGFDPEKFAKLRPEQKTHVVYHLTRILEGEDSAVLEWEYFDMKVDLRPWQR